ncbi:GHMP family kinase ATP-binding protein [Streptomyces thermolilacinus]|uniref:GHMP family kinase ATP-binding protein n=1 Tax=Streptomyces thermolilacinus TaxID=285540 RepID=UPI0003C74F69|nr:GHMP kinase [Streptomyces thermolilacinus]
MSGAADLWVSSAPLRISLAGGGTDLPAYAHRFGGTVLGASVDLRVTVFGRRARTATVIRACLDSCGSADSVDGLANPYAREALKRYWDGSPVDLFSAGDVPGGSGMGSSAAFCVALVAGLSGKERSPHDLAMAASGIEMDGLGRPVGRQDHFLSALGGFRQLHFATDGRVTVEDVPVADDVVRRLDEELVLHFTGTSRDAGAVLGDQARAAGSGERGTEARLHEIKELTGPLREALTRGDSTEVGRILGRHWELKRGLGARVSLPGVDRAYRDALAAGATGGKLLGAGGGGFLLLHVPAAAREGVRAAMAVHGMPEQPFRFDPAGARLSRL